MTISHNGVIACEQVISFKYIDYIYIRAASGTKWQLYDSNLIGTPIHGVGVPTWNEADVTY
eukprot:5533002-Heterocapsa_arctica.AAC.1